MIISGNSQINKVYYSGYTISKIYACGGSLVWSDTPTPPTGDKCQMIFNTWSGDTTYSIPCNSSSVLSHTETDITEYSRVSLKEVIIGSCVTEVGYNAFNRASNLTSVTLSNTVTTIGDVAFENCPNLTSITFPNSLVTIGNQSFMYDFGLTSLNIPDSVTSIGSQAFFQCYGLTAVTIGSGITSIDNSAFENCSALTSVTINATTPPTLDLGDEFANTNNCPIYVPCESVNAYKTAHLWSTYASRIQGIPPCTETIYRWVDLDPSDDYYCSGMGKCIKQKKQQSVDDGETWTDVSPAEYQRGDYVEYVSSDCGYDNTGRINFIEDMSTNSSTTSCVTAFTLVSRYDKLYNFDIASDTICGLRGVNGSTVVRKVRSVVFPNNTRTIDTYAFYKNNSYDTSKKKLILFNEGLETIGDYAFDEFTGGDVDDTMFNVLVIPSTVTYIGHDALNFDGNGFSSGPSNQWLHIYFKGTTPPTMADDIFGGIGEVQMNKQIVLYVPQGTLQAYTDALPANYKISSNPMSIVEYTESSSAYDLDMFSLKTQLINQGFLS